MAKETVEVLVEGGKASGGPPIGPALGPLGVNVAQVVKTINDKTEGFKGMHVPVKIIVDTDTKSFEITVGTPPTSALVKKELGLKKGSGKAGTDFVGDLSVEQLIKIVKMKQDQLTGKTLKEKAKEVAGTCVSLGVKIDGKPAKEFLDDVASGKYDNAFN